MFSGIINSRIIIIIPLRIFLVRRQSPTFLLLKLKNNKVDGSVKNMFKRAKLVSPQNGDPPRLNFSKNIKRYIKYIYTPNGILIPELVPWNGFFFHPHVFILKVVISLV